MKQASVALGGESTVVFVSVSGISAPTRRSQWQTWQWAV